MRKASPIRPALTFLALLLVAGAGLQAAAPGPRTQVKTTPPPTEVQKREALRALQPDLAPEQADARLRRLEAAWSRCQSMGLLDGKAWAEDQEEGRRAVLVKAYVDTLPGHGRMDEDQVRRAFLAQPEQRRVSHILCPSEAEAAAALQRVRAGEPFEGVAKACSKDPGVALNQGQLGWIRQDQMVAAFGGPVFAAAVGDLVGPLKSEFGWHVAKVWELRRPKEADFPAQREALLREARSVESRMKRDKALEGLRKRFPLAPDLKVLAADRTTESLPGDERKTAGRVAGTTISLKALKAHLADVLKTLGQSHSLGAATKARFMEELADEIRLAVAAKRAGLDQRPEVRAALWLDQRIRARARFASAHLAAFPVTESDLQDHLAAHGDRFRPVGAVRLQVLVADSQSRVEEALNAVRGGMPWRDAASRFASPEATGDPEPGWVEVEDLRKLVPPSLMQPILSGTLLQPVGPMLGPDGFMIFNVQERRPGAVPPLDRCRDEVKADYLKVHREPLVDEALDQGA